ncbi:hypothetical protein CEXT_419871 [Caerostris extrusa]|uniref:Uncharacterized protein n=1 Tax=Caerostris extrusa TaxID=172846 RepID=A0AAV4SJJ5_CAEEX|nr:hypothetical protein CEXT_419871 [Caerostris extrusa]
MNHTQPAGTANTTRIELKHKKAKVAGGPFQFESQSHGSPFKSPSSIFLHTFILLKLNTDKSPGRPKYPPLSYFLKP